MADSAQVEKKKKEKHSQTEGRRRKVKVPGAEPPATGAGRAGERSSSALRCHSKSASTSSAQKAQASSAQRHDPVSCTMPSWTTGAAAQPRLPLMPCTENAWP